MAWAFVSVAAGQVPANPFPGPSGPGLRPPRLVDAPPVVAPRDGPPVADDAAVELELTLDAAGRVTEATVVAPLRDDLDARVLEAARAARFFPATRDGAPIPARIRFRYRVSRPPAAVEPAPPDAPAPDEAPPQDEPPILDAEGVVGIVAEVERREEGAAQVYVLEAEELTTVPGTNGEPVRVVAALPGVARSPFGLGYFLVRGANFQNTGYFVDGFPVPNLYHLAAGPSVLHNRLVSRMRFYPGGYPVAYGRFTAGVVALETSPLESRNFRAEGQVDGYRGSVLATVPIPDGLGQITASFRRSYYDLLIPLYSEIAARTGGEDLRNNPFSGIDFAYTDYALRAELTPSRRVAASILVFGSDDYFDQTGTFEGGSASEGARTNLGIDFQRLIARLRLRSDDGPEVTIAGMLGRDGNRFGSAQPGREDLRFSQETLVGGLRIDAFLPLSDMFRTRFGLDALANVYDLDATLPSPPGFGEYPRPIFDPQLLSIGQRLVSESVALYLDQVVDLDPVEISLGGRFELFRHGTRLDPYADPRAVVRWQVVPELLLKVASGSFTQAPSPYSASASFGSPDIPAERSWQSSGGVEVTLPLAIEAQVTGYYTRFYDLVRNVDELVETPEGATQRRTVVADGQGQAYGLEVLLRRRIEEGLFGWISYTLSRSERFVDDGLVVPFQFDQTHVLNFALSVDVNGWRFGARFQLATGPWTTRIVGGAYDADGDAYSPIRRGLTERLPLYHRLDVRFDRTFHIGPIEGAFFVDIQNVYNAPSQEGILYQYDFRASAPLRGLPILPTAGIRFSFEPGVTDEPARRRCCRARARRRERRVRRALRPYESVEETALPVPFEPAPGGDPAEDAAGGEP